MQKKTYDLTKIKKATPQDLSEIHLIEKESFSNPWKISFFSGELSNVFSNTFIYREKDEEQAIGFIIFRKIADTIEIIKIAVKKNYRDMGIGSFLMNFILSGPYSDEILSFFLEVRTSNDEAIRFYKKFGFNITGIRKNYYSNPTEDALILNFRKN
ncbi:MAG: ribosomal protein S18-alanine N-acetyltransferase [Acidobacteriota bacterium]